MTKNETPYDRLSTRLREIGTLSAIEALLGWDQETMMPPKAGSFRAEELSLVSRLLHDRRTDPALGELLGECEGDPAIAGDACRAADLRELRRDYGRATRIPSDLVAELSETSSRAMQAWKNARQENDFSSFLPWLEKQISLNRDKAECLGAPEGGEPYDALLEEYEPGMTASEAAALFDPLREALSSFLSEIAESPVRHDPGFVEAKVPVEAQQEFNLQVAKRLGYDLEAGRLDVSVHPFTEGLGPGDTRITTRYREDRPADALASTMHETGHALYEQGLPKDRLPGHPLSQAASMGIHESQSRLWENQVGRSRPFWEWALPLAREILGAPVESYSVDDVYRSVNAVIPKLIRVESDEATYNLHIMLRFDLELAMFRGDLSPRDLPAAWNDRMKRDLGLRVPDDRRGCLQDIHWSVGAFGYFPTYTLGNLYAAQMWEAARREILDLDRRIACGEFGSLLEWLRAGVHAHGRRYPAGELGRRITGAEPGYEPLLRYLEGKLRPIYRL
jgi:carboxypeptidase Taq